MRNRVKFNAELAKEINAWNNNTKDNLPIKNKTIENAALERKVLRKIYGGKELIKQYGKPCITGIVRAQRVK